MKHILKINELFAFGPGLIVKEIISKLSEIKNIQKSDYNEYTFDFNGESYSVSKDTGLGIHEDDYFLFNDNKQIGKNGRVESIFNEVERQYNW